MGSLNPNEMINYLGIASEHEFPQFPIAYKQFLILEKECVPEPKPDIECINKISASVCIQHTKIIRSPYDTKLLVNGIIKQYITYTADLPDQPVHQFHFEVPFCELIILDSCRMSSYNVVVKPFIENIHFLNIEKRKVELCKTICLTVVEGDCYL